MNEMEISISCDVCQDLIPLVIDQVASEDSVDLVMNHIKGCEPCRRCYESTSQLEAERFTPDDQLILQKIKKTFSYSLILFILIGGFLGIAITNSQNLFYNSIIMPVVGILCYMVFRKRWYIPCIIVVGITYVWIFITCWIEGGFSPYLFTVPLLYDLIYSILLMIGVSIATLLTYAFGKEKMI